MGPPLSASVVLRMPAKAVGTVPFEVAVLSVPLGLKPSKESAVVLPEWPSTLLLLVMLLGMPLLPSSCTKKLPLPVAVLPATMELRKVRVPEPKKTPP